MLSVPPDVICCEEKKQTRKTTAYMDVVEKKRKKGMLPQHLCPEMFQRQETHRTSSGFQGLQKPLNSSR